MAFNNFPYADLNITNLDWLFDQQKELREFVDDSMTHFAERYLDKVYINARYSEPDQTLQLYTETSFAESEG
jgi:hypothetical protein